MSTAPIPFDTGGPERAAGAVVAIMYERHARPLFGLCRMLLRDPVEAEDALQSTFLSAYRALLRGDEPRDSSAWLSTIARNECRARIRNRMREPVGSPPEVLEGIVDQRPSPVEHIGDDTVRKALAALPEKQREAVVLHDLFGLRSREVGVALGLSVTAVEASLFRARRQLRTRLRSTTASVMVVPVGMQETLAGLIPGFAAGTAAFGGTSVLGAGLLAKLVGLPGAVKVAAGVAALATAGSVVAVESDSPAPNRPALVRSVPDADPAAGQPVGATPTDSGAAELEAASNGESGRAGGGKGKSDGRSKGQGSSASSADPTDNEGGPSGDQDDEDSGGQGSANGGSPTDGVLSQGADDDDGRSSGSGSGANSGAASRDDEERDEPAEREGEGDGSGSGRSGAGETREDESSSGSSETSGASGDSGDEAESDGESGSDHDASRDDDPDSSGRVPASDGDR